MDINYYKTNHYTRCGCNITGNLMVFEYQEACRKLAKSQPLNEWGQSSYRDVIDEIEKDLKKKNINYKTELCMPDFVIRLL